MIFSELDFRFMQEAFKEALRAFDTDEIPVGAVVVYKDKIIGRGYNQTRLLKDPTAHAEMIALTAAASSIGDELLNECSIYCTLEPCPMCAGAIVLSRVQNLYFAAFEPKTGACGSLYNIADDKRLNHQVKVFSGLMESDSKFLLKNFFSLKRTPKNHNIS